MSLGSGSALLKGIAVTAVALVMLVPLVMLSGLVSERTTLRSRAIDSVARGWGGPQLVGGPMLAIPVTSSDSETRTLTRDWYMLPDKLVMDVALTVEKEPRKLGVYEVPVYSVKIHARGQFDVAREVIRLKANDGSLQVHLDRARLLVPISDPRGVRDVKVPENQIGPGGLSPARGFPIPVLAAPVSNLTDAGSDNPAFDVTLELAGTESLRFLPLARSTRLQAAGNWPHPGFTNGFLPIERSITPNGFTARWQVLDLNRTYGSRWFEGDASLADLEQSAFGIDLVQPVDLYQQVSRAVKYGALFIALSLLTLFLFESLIRRPLHPIQYGLMGLALSVFYLLLLALAEQIGFRPAYILAALALCSLIGVYLAGVLRSRNAGIAAGGIFAAVYALLYLLVTSEDYALLAGALALFALLATLMLLTRRLDWYQPRE
jgi:inner membrane protein